MEITFFKPQAGQPKKNSHWKFSHIGFSIKPSRQQSLTANNTSRFFPVQFFTPDTNSKTARPESRGKGRMGGLALSRASETYSPRITAITNHKQPFVRCFCRTLSDSLGPTQTLTHTPNDGIIAQLQRLDQWSWCSHRHCHPTLTWCGGSQRILPFGDSAAAVSMPMTSAFTRFVQIAYSSHSISDRKSSSAGKKTSWAILDWNKWPLNMLLIVLLPGLEDWKSSKHRFTSIRSNDRHRYRVTQYAGCPPSPQASKSRNRPVAVVSDDNPETMTWSITLLYKKCHDWKDMGSGHKRISCYSLLIDLAGPRDFAYGYWQNSVSQNSFGFGQLCRVHILVDLRYPIEQYLHLLIDATWTLIVRNHTKSANSY